jgi:hypothetical protein
MHEHACDLARQHRAHRVAWRGVLTSQGDARPCRGRCDATGWSCLGRDARGVRRCRPPKCGGNGFCRGARGAGSRPAAAGLGAAGFHRNRIWGAVDERTGRTRSRSAPPCDGACSGCGQCVANGSRRAGMRRNRCRGARGLGRSASARSRCQSQADAGRAGLGRHRSVVADGGGATTLHGGNQMDRARGAFAACEGFNPLGRAVVGRAPCP